MGFNFKPKWNPEIFFTNLFKVTPTDYSKNRRCSKSLTYFAWYPADKKGVLYPVYCQMFIISKPGVDTMDLFRNQTENFLVGYKSSYPGISNPLILLSYIEKN